MIHVLSDDPDGTELLDELKRGIGDADAQQLNIAIFDGQQLTIERLIEACAAMPFLAERRLVVVRGLLARFESAGKPATQSEGSAQTGPDDASAPANGQTKTSGLQRALAEYLARIPPTAQLVFVEPVAVSSKNPLRKALLGAGAVFAETPAMQGEALAKWIERRMAKKGARLAPGVSALLASYPWQDLRQLDGELDKLAVYAGTSPVDIAAVRQVVAAAREVNVYKMADAIAVGDAAQALGRMRDLLADGEHPLYLLTMTVRQFRLLVQIKDLRSRGLSVDDIAAKVRAPAFVVERMLRQLRRYPAFGQLDDVYAKLLAADLAAKSGGPDADVSIELLIGDLAGKRL